MEPNTTDLELALPERPVPVYLPSGPRDLRQDEEWFEVDHGGRRRKLRLHDYATIYGIPGLYESLVYRTLQCRSPERVVRGLEEALMADSLSPNQLRVLDLGAGNGIVGELLRRIGVRDLVALDLLPEAAEAARRDRPHVYDDYIITDLTASDPAAKRRLREFGPTCLVAVAVLSFGTPPEAFVKAFNLLPSSGWLALCIKDSFLEGDDSSGIGRLVRGMIADDTIAVVKRERYVHRRSVSGEKLFYVAVIARKRRHARLP
ncbi:MAG: hypothetical protein JOZ63_00975 [Planctomycetaceae bacterium]|nr:hypothetical protein [Planctomycetaceae bacterium]